MCETWSCMESVESRNTLRWRIPCLQDIKVHHGADICSNHHFVIDKIKIKLERQKKVKKIPKCFDTSKLKNPAIGLRFQAMLQNSFFALAEPIPAPTEWWD